MLPLGRKNTFSMCKTTRKQLGRRTSLLRSPVLLPRSPSLLLLIPSRRVYRMRTLNIKFQVLLSSRICLNMKVLWPCSKVSHRRFAHFFLYIFRTTESSDFWEIDPRRWSQARVQLYNCPIIDTLILQVCLNQTWHAKGLRSYPQLSWMDNQNSHKAWFIDPRHNGVR